MRIYPTLEEVQQLAATGKYDVIPVSGEILSDFITPIEALRILKNISKHTFMLESAQADETWGRYTFLGFDPISAITCVGGSVNGVLEAGKVKYVTGNPNDYLREVLSHYRSPRFPNLPPFTGGLMGYFAYDYFGYSEPSIRKAVTDTEQFRDVDLMLFDKIITFDNIRQKII
ncbi:MAG: anthranilate synthase component I, partial [Lachnospiraceae bacterium]|nr:anthranilate synthase component I [Lachnospiraceae bacterium]